MAKVEEANKAALAELDSQHVMDIKRAISQLDDARKRNAEYETAYRDLIENPPTVTEYVTEYLENPTCEQFPSAFNSLWNSYSMPATGSADGSD